MSGEASTLYTTNSSSRSQIRESEEEPPVSISALRSKFENLAASTANKAVPINRAGKIVPQTSLAATSRNDGYGVVLGSTDQTAHDAVSESI